MNAETPLGPEALSPDLRIADPATRWWCGHVVLRLRLEIAWQRHLGSRDAAQSALDLLRHGEAKSQFFATDIASQYLSARLNAEPPDGQFTRLADAIELTNAERFVLAMGIIARTDAALGPVFAACHGDATQTLPSLTVAQLLWSNPIEVLDVEDPSRPLRRLGLIDSQWCAPALLAKVLCIGASALPYSHNLKERQNRNENKTHALGARLIDRPNRLEVVALVGSARNDAGSLVSTLCDKRKIWPIVFDRVETLRTWLVLASIEDIDVWLKTPLSHREVVSSLVPALSVDLPVRLYLHLESQSLVAALPQERMGPVVAIQPLSYRAREYGLKAALGDHIPDGTIKEVARDFKLEALEVAQIRAGNEQELLAACRAECSLDFQGLADPIEPRFCRNDIVLPSAVDSHFNEALSAIQGASRLCHEWEGSKLSDGGIQLLFAGVPGTGKTMAAEIIACETGLPMFQVDLSQVVNKYVGETEKNLKRIFDAAERMRCVLFFDEADTLFAKRFETKNANDRFANMETGYLLQRMETFTGVSVLATNRRKDLDEAFSRRLRYIIEFPMPGETERRQIWEKVFPEKIDTSQLDIGFLSKRFQIAGGHIRSIALNAGLQAAARGNIAQIIMRDVLVATKRELDKLNRKSGADAFGPYYEEFEELRS